MAGWVFRYGEGKKMDSSGASHTVWDEVGWTAPAILANGNESKAADLLRRYFAPDRTGHRGSYSGAMFTELGGGGDRHEVKDVFTAVDLIAVSTLSVDVPPTHALQLLGLGVTAKGLKATRKWRKELDHDKTLEWSEIPSVDCIPIDASAVSDALARVPANMELAKVRVDQIDELMTCVDLLWREVRRKGVLDWKDGKAEKTHPRALGETTASKLLARKRPRLLPIIDKEVKAQLCQDSGKKARKARNIGFYRSMWEVMSDSGLALPTHLSDIREQAFRATCDERIRRLSDLRVFDIVVWMYAKDQKK